MQYRYIKLNREYPALSILLLKNQQEIVLKRVKRVIDIRSFVIGACLRNAFKSGLIKTKAI